MSLRECYERLGADYEDMFSRIGNEGLMKKFLQMFLEDESYAQLLQALKEEKAEEAFRAAHTLKGVALNLALTKLVSSASGLTETLRGGKIPDNIADMVEAVTKDYEQTVKAIAELE